MSYTTHELKTWPEYFEALIAKRKKRKTFEIRENDRDYKVGDLLWLKEYDPKTKAYTGRETLRWVTYILDKAPFVPKGYVVMSIN